MTKHSNLGLCFYTLTINKQRKLIVHLQVMLTKFKPNIICILIRSTHKFYQECNYMHCVWVVSAAVQITQYNQTNSYAAALRPSPTCWFV